MTLTTNQLYSISQKIYDEIGRLPNRANVALMHLQNQNQTGRNLFEVISGEKLKLYAYEGRIYYKIDGGSFCSSWINHFINDEILSKFPLTESGIDFVKGYLKRGGNKK